MIGKHAYLSFHKRQVNAFAENWPCVPADHLSQYFYPAPSIQVIRSAHGSHSSLVSWPSAHLIMYLWFRFFFFTLKKPHFYLPLGFSLLFFWGTSQTWFSLLNPNTGGEYIKLMGFLTLCQIPQPGIYCWSSCPALGVCPPLCLPLARTINERRQGAV